MVSPTTSTSCNRSVRALPRSGACIGMDGNHANKQDMPFAHLSRTTATATATACDTNGQGEPYRLAPCPSSSAHRSRTVLCSKVMTACDTDGPGEPYRTFSPRSAPRRAVPFAILGTPTSDNTVFPGDCSRASEINKNCVPRIFLKAQTVLVVHLFSISAPQISYHPVVQCATQNISDRKWDSVIPIFRRFIL